MPHICNLRTDGIIQARAARAARLAALALIVTFGAAGVWVATGVDGYRVTSMPDPNSVINPLAKSVMRVRGAWLENYIRFPLMLAAPVAAFAGALGVALLATLRHPLLTLLASATSVTGVILTAGLSMFPFVMPSSSDPASSLTAWDSVSSHRTLQLMFWVTVVFLPLIGLYTSWVYSRLWGKVTAETVRDEH